MWPATSHLGEGSLLQLLQSMVLVLRRCTSALVSLDAPLSMEMCDSGDSSSTVTGSSSASEALRYAECVGECMRSMSAMLKSRRKATIPPISLLHSAFASNDKEEDAWGATSSEILLLGCQLLTCQGCNKVSSQF